MDLYVCMVNECKTCYKRLQCEREEDIMKQVKAKSIFKDIEANVIRNVGDVFEVNTERATKLLNAGFIEIIADVEEKATPIAKIEKAISKTIKKDTKIAKK